LAETRTLFRTDDVLARLQGGFGEHLCFVTFGYRTDDSRLERPGFGEAFFLSERIDAIHVTTRQNRWFDMPECRSLLNAIAQASARYERVIAYGSSMGGFAALHFAVHIGADTAVALSPQYAVDARNAPFETRWRDETRGVRFPDVPSAPAPKQVLICDPVHGLDARHAACFQARGPVITIPVHYGGHPVSTVLEQAGLLKPLVRAVASDSLRPGAFIQALRQARRGSSQYLWGLSRALPSRRSALALRLAHMAVAAQRTVHSLSHLAVLLTRNGETQAAQALLDEALRIAPGDIHASLAFAALLKETGRTQEAKAILTGLRRRHPRNRLVAGRLLRHRLGAWGLGGVHDRVAHWLRSAKRSPARDR